MGGLERDLCSDVVDGSVHPPIYGNTVMADRVNHVCLTMVMKMSQGKL